ncbi:phasin family protein [Mesorhizobium sp. SB112]|uniref:phasin family protein n=1 Tax=Mesorhizobium sp. SB112 TaxID=3151853 RepID=UPI003264ED76
MAQFENAGNFGAEFVDHSLKSFAALSKGTQAIAAEAGDYTKKSFENGGAAFEKLISSKSLESAVQVQADYAKSAYEGFVAEATKISELYADLAKEAYRPFEQAVAKAS